MPTMRPPYLITPPTTTTATCCVSAVAENSPTCAVAEDIPDSTSTFFRMEDVEVEACITSTASHDTTAAIIDISHMTVKAYKEDMHTFFDQGRTKLLEKADHRSINIALGNQPLPSQRAQRLLKALPRLETGEFQGQLVSPTEDDSTEPDCYFSLAGGWEKIVAPPPPSPPPRSPLRPPAPRNIRIDSCTTSTSCPSTPQMTHANPIAPFAVLHPNSPTQDQKKPWHFDWHRAMKTLYGLHHQDLNRYFAIVHANKWLLRNQSIAERGARERRFADYFSSLQNEDRALMQLRDSMSAMLPGLSPAYETWRYRTAWQTLVRVGEERECRDNWATWWPDTVHLVLCRGW